MTALILDCETSDLLQKDLPLTAPEQPWCCALAAQLVDDEGRMVDFIATRIKAEGRSIKAGAQAVHGVSSRQAGRAGVSEIAALAILCDFAAQAECMVGYGVGFDRDVIESLLLRRGKDARMWVRPGLQVVDLIPPCAAICRLPSDHPSGGYKWPTLDQATAAVINLAPRSGHHTAWDDCERARLLWLALRQRGALEAA